MPQELPSAMDAEAPPGAGPDDREWRDHSHRGREKKGLTVSEGEEWKDMFLLAAENAVRSNPKDEEPRKKLK